MARRNYEDMLDEHSESQTETPAESGYEVGRLQHSEEMMEKCNSQMLELLNNITVLDTISGNSLAQIDELKQKIAQLPPSVKCSIVTAPEDQERLQQMWRQTMLEGTKGGLEEFHRTLQAEMENFRDELKKIKREEKDNGIYMSMRQLTYWTAVFAVLLLFGSYGVTLYAQATGSGMIAVWLICGLALLIIVGAVGLLRKNR